MRKPASPKSILGALLLALAIATTVRADEIVFHLANGDRIAGVVLTEATNQIVLSNRWAGRITIPASEIVSRETNAIAPPHLLAGPKREAARSSYGIAVAAITPPHTGSISTNKWQGEIRLGAGYVDDSTHQETFTGRFKLAYDRPYDSNPNRHFRNALDVSIAYGRITTHTNSTVSQNQLDTSDKSSWDFDDRFYAYNLMAGGYDQLQNIKSRYEIGPGIGYHAVTQTNFHLNLEAGANYQVQNRIGSADTHDFFDRVAQDIIWKPTDRVTWTEKFEFFPRVDFGSYRSRFESNVAYALWRKLSLNLTVLDLYDSDPAADVTRNDFEVRSMLGYAF